MSGPAWSALADRFAALASEQEFEFRTYPFDRPTAFQDDDNRFRFVYPSGRNPDSPAEYAVVIGSETDRGAEFARLNRFRWLSWSAGLLLRPDPYFPPELCWWQHVRREHGAVISTSPDQGRSSLPELVRLSAETARQIAGAGGRIPAQPPSLLEQHDNWPEIQGAFRLLRERFNAPRWHSERPGAALVAFPDHQAFGAWTRRDVERAVVPQQPHYPSRASRGTVWGSTDAVNAFVEMARDAANSLPIELSFTPPMFPWFNCIENTHRIEMPQWLEFLFLVCPSAFTLEADWPGRGCRIARLNSSPFYVSTNAIDRLLSADSPTFLRRFRDGAARFNPWFGDEDRAATVRAVEGSSRRPTTSAGGNPHMAMHWTEYPTQVEKLGDLVSILETLDRDEAENRFSGDMFRRESEESAYSVDPFPTGVRFNPRLDRMPGLERLLDHFDVDDSFTLAQIRELRRRAANALNLDRAAVNAMIFTQIADALDAPKGLTSSPSTPPNGSEPFTVNDVLLLVRSQQVHERFRQWQLAKASRPRSDRSPLLDAQEAAYSFAHTPSRLSLEQAVMLPGYLRLLEAARVMGRPQLDEPTLLYLVGGVACRHGRSLEEMWVVPLDEFERMMDSTGGGDNQTPRPKGADSQTEKKRATRRRGPRGRSPAEVEADIKLYEDYLASGLIKEDFIRKRFRADEFENMMTRLETGRKDHAARQKGAGAGGE